jgi:hypothetical protein
METLMSISRTEIGHDHQFEIRVTMAEDDGPEFTVHRLHSIYQTSCEWRSSLE